MSFFFPPSAYQNIHPFAFLFHPTVSSLIFIALLANSPSLTKVHEFSYLIRMEEARSHEHGASCVSCLTLRLGHTSPQESHLCPFHGSALTHSSTELIVAWYEQWSLVSASSLFPDFILLSSKY